MPRPGLFEIHDDVMVWKSQKDSLMRSFAVALVSGDLRRDDTHMTSL